MLEPYRFEKAVDTLKKKRVLENKLTGCVVRTEIKINSERKWYFFSNVIYDDEQPSNFSPDNNELFISIDLCAEKAVEKHFTKHDEAVQARIRVKKAEFKKKKKARLIKILILLTILLLASTAIGFYLPYIVQKKDVVPPHGSIDGIKDSYFTGDEVTYVIRANDNKELKQVTFEVKNSSVKELWNVQGESDSITFSFSTKGWQEGTYEYLLVVEDNANNVPYKQTGNFILREIQYGYVNINTIPWTEIYNASDNERYGMTPINLKFPAGKVKIRFVNKSEGINEIKTIQINADETTPVSFKWK
jgi:hypothetical protein